MSKLGYGTYTLTDLTETLPVSLILETNQEKNVQTKNGSFYEPDYTSGDGLIISPSLFVGSQKVKDIPLEGDNGFLFYEIGDKKYRYNALAAQSDIYVNNKGQLVIKENLSSTLTVEAYIQEYKNKAQGYTIELVQATPIDILFLEASSSYNAVIGSAEGREVFTDTSSTPITLTAYVYKGNTELDVNDFSYAWDFIGDGKQENISVERSITVERKDITSAGTYICRITDKITGIEYTVSKTLYDKTDEYYCNIITDKPLFLNETNSAINLTAKVFKGGELVSNGFTYRWVIFDGDTENTISGETAEKLKVSVDSSFVPSKKNFTIACEVSLENRVVALSYISIQYLLEYRIKISPKTIFVKTSSDGSYLGESNKQYSFSFQLNGNDGNLLNYDTSDTQPSGKTNSDGTTLTFKRGTENKWDFIGTLDFSGSKLWNSGETSYYNLTSQTYEFSYTYAGISFIDEVEVVKAYAGENGEQGFSGYVVDLTNEYHMFSGSQTAALPDQTASCAVAAYYGDAPCEITKITIGGTDDNVIYNGNSSTVSYNSNLVFSTSKSTEEKVNIDIKTGPSGTATNFLTVGGTLQFFITIKGKDNAEKTFIRAFSYGIYYNGKAYSLSTDIGAVTYSKGTNTYSPDKLTASGVGIIIYSYDKLTWTYTSNGIINDFKSGDATHIYLRLYDAKATGLTSGGSIAAATLDNYTNYLMDEETVPIITSADGYEIGGENLLRWTKPLTVATDKWIITGNKVSQGADGDFSVMDFSASGNSTDIWHSYLSPAMRLEPEYVGRQFCLSFYVYYSGTFTANDGLQPTLQFYKEMNSTSRARYRAIGRIFPAGTSTIVADEGLEANKWNKVYCLFTMEETESDSTGLEIMPSLDECECFRISFYLKRNGVFRVKKPKLEIGNIATDWSASPYDVNYTNVVGTNLSSIDGLLLEVKTSDPYVVFAENLAPSTYYTFSCSSSSYTGTDYTSFLCRIMKETTVVSFFTLLNDEDNAQSYTFQTPSTEGNYSVWIYATTNTSAQTNGYKLSIRQAKLEEGTTATPFFITDDYINNLIENLQNQSNATINIVNSQGQTITTTQEELKNTINALTTTQTQVNNQNATISAMSSRIAAQGDQLSQITGYIKIDASDANNPNITITTKSDNTSLSTKITNSQLGFYYNNDEKPVAYINKDTLEINQAKFNETFSIGNLQVSITESGVGFTW